uniref:Radical SAM superfamily protein n=1 Tax=Candidatus Kentrum sp. UNK TaxID=2126344 RepID=A0A451AEG2_9GAMM|nr:MAG: Radical SAM superfamily protein [Candidatus Kentron sp. UNK]VFK71071.1 MAG: Radical SAM superfamily protein [Candidatus Kentron sp. UNK]
MNTMHKPKKLYLINPKTPYPSYAGAEIFENSGFLPALFSADLSTTTVAALMSPHFEVTICDERITPVDFDIDTNFVALTGQILQWERTKEIAKAFRQRGKVVIIGGSYASLSYEKVRPYCDILVRGEIDEVANDIFSEIAEGNWKDEYVGTVPDLANSPLPRWDLYPHNRALIGSIQVSRGCPFQCEFCDVIQYVGRKQRHKPVPRILQELDNLYALGFRRTFIADDNFTVHRKKAKEILLALKEWNEKREGQKMAFSTQLSLDAARDDEMLRMLQEAGFGGVFIGIETPNADSLKEVKKFQNVGVDSAEKYSVLWNTECLLLEV